MWMWLWAWVGSTPSAGAESTMVRDLGAFRIRTLEGETESQTVGAHGVVAIYGESVRQTLAWQPAVGSLAAVAHHELQLIVESARATRGQLSTDGFVHTARAGGRDALTWSAKVDNTKFVGITVDCPMVRVVLVTFGANEDLVERLQRRSLNGLVCKR